MIAIVIVLIIIFSPKNVEVNQDAYKSTGSGSQIIQAVDITYGNIANFLGATSLTKDLPEGFTVSLKTYNFDSGEREWEKSYLITNQEVIEQEVLKYDLLITLHSKYIDELNSGNFCSVMQKARKNGDMGIESSLSDLELAWKLKGMTKHKSCFGL